MSGSAARDGTGDGRPRILFVAEAVTLAHVARPFVLAQALDPAHYEVVLAADPRFNKLLSGSAVRFRPITSIPCERFLNALAKGQPVYDAETLRTYVKEDLAVLRETAPALVVGDFRLSLSVSARLTRTPYVTISNAYWSPYAQRRFPMPELPMTPLLGVHLAQCLFSMARPFAFALHTLPLNRVRAEHGLPRLGFNLCRVYTDADYTLYADIPQLIPTRDLPANHRYLGPVLWSPSVELPAWWNQLPPDRPVVYVTLGSSGAREVLRFVLDGLADLPVSVLVATAGRIDVGAVSGNTFVADYLPGDEAAARSNLVICNGGSPTTQQALAAGKPVLGIASNMDQFMNMEAVQRLGAGELLRAGRTDAPRVRDAVNRILARPGYREAAARLAKMFAAYDSRERFRGLLVEIVGPGPRPAPSLPMESLT